MYLRSGPEWPLEGSGEHPFEGFETTLDSLYVTRFASTRNFGPFYGFTKGCPSSARIAVAEMMR